MKTSITLFIALALAFSCRGQVITGITGYGDPVERNDDILWDDAGNSHRLQAVSQGLIQQQIPPKEQWTPIGPWGGDVLDIAIYPPDPDILVAAAGYPYITYDGGGNWELLTSLTAAANSMIHTIECTPGGTIFAAGDYLIGKGYMSIDTGTTWQMFSIPINRSIFDIAYDPQDPQILYCGLSAALGATSSQVMVRSGDGGQSWTLLDLTAALPVGYGVLDIAVNPLNSQMIFAVGNEGISNARIAASFDGGMTWEDRTGNLPSGKPYNAVTIAGNTVFMAGGQLFGGQNVGLYKSADWGQTWLNISASFPKKVVNDVRIDPADTLKIFAGTEGDGVYYSADGGTTWAYQTQGDGDQGSVRSIAFPPSGTDTLYAGYLSLGVCRSVDNGQSWSYAHRGIASLLVNDINLQPGDPDVILAGFEAENSGGCYLSTDGAANWGLVTGLPATRFSVVDVAQDGTMYTWSNGPSSVAPEGLYKSTDGGITWNNTGPNIGSLFETQIFSLDISPEEPEQIFIGGNNFGVNGWDAIIYRTSNGGQTWDSVYTGPANNSVLHLHIVPGQNSQIIYAAYKSQDHSGGFLKSMDGGTSWQEINTGIPSGCKYAGCIASAPDDPDVLIAGIGGQGDINGTAVTSQDGGLTWTGTPLSLGIYSQPKDLLIHPGYADVIYLATSQNGVYFTQDAGLSWSPANEGMPATHITSFSMAYEEENEWHTCSATYTHSAFRSAIFTPGATTVDFVIAEPASLTIFPNPARETLFIMLPGTAPAETVMNISDLTGRLRHRCTLKGRAARVDLMKTGLSSGVYICRVSGEGFMATSRMVVR
ncbi:MAG: T9SS type A sorting domain-containing protein [Bacteroidales bacterium]|nr:T9SS type A sorting domain-containing protein [Bacteroidales bacterium]